MIKSIFDKLLPNILSLATAKYGERFLDHRTKFKEYNFNVNQRNLRIKLVYCSKGKLVEKIYANDEFIAKLNSSNGKEVNNAYLTLHLYRLIILDNNLFRKIIDEEAETHIRVEKGILSRSFDFKYRNPVNEVAVFGNLLLTLTEFLKNNNLNLSDVVRVNNPILDQSTIFKIDDLKEVLDKTYSFIRYDTILPGQINIPIINPDITFELKDGVIIFETLEYESTSLTKKGQYFSLKLIRLSKPKV